MAVVEGVGVPEAGKNGVVAPEGELKPPASVKFFYSVGQVVESGYLAINAFVFFYYTAVLGLSGTLVGVALAISMCLDAAADPLIGSWSDSVRSRGGDGSSARAKHSSIARQILWPLSTSVPSQSKMARRLLIRAA